MKGKIMLCLLLCVLGGNASLALAGDEALYGKTPPADASFFRVLNAADTDELEVVKDGEKIIKVSPLEVTPYGFFEGAKATFLLNGKEVAVKASPGSMVTLVWDGHRAAAIEEEPFADLRKARLKLFNISNEPVSLSTVDSKTEVIGEVAPYGYKYRNVKALNLPFLVKNGDKTLLTTDSISLAKGTASSIFYIQRGASSISLISSEKQ